MINQELNIAIMPNGSLELEWHDVQDAVSKSARLLQEEVYKRFAGNNDSWLLFLGFCDHQVLLSPSLEFWRDFTGLFAQRLIQTPDLDVLRHRLKIPIETDDAEQFLARAPLMTGAEYLSAELLESVWSRLNRTFGSAIKSHKGTVDDFIRTYSPNVHLVGRIFFHLVESKRDDFPFAFMATYSTRLDKKGKSRHLPLKHALQEYENDSEKLLELLTTVHRAAKQSNLLSDLLETGELFHPLVWAAKEAFLFLKEIPIYEESGILCRIPNWWKGSTSRVSLNFSVGDSKPSFVGMDAILSFKPRLLLGDI